MPTPPTPAWPPWPGRRALRRSGAPPSGPAARLPAELARPPRAGSGRAMDQDQDQKLIVFLDSLGQDADVDFARGVLEAHDWDVEAALLTVTGAGEAPSAPSAALDGLDEEGYRAPMRTGYHDTLLGPTPEDFARAAADAQRGDLGAGGPDGAGGRHDRAGRDMDLAMQASRGHRQQEQGAIAQAMQASLAAHMEMEQRRYEGGANADAERNEEQKMIAQAIEVRCIYTYIYIYICI